MTAAAFHRRWCGQPRRNQANRANTNVIGPADAIAVVVGIVDADLQCKAHDQCQPDSPPTTTGRVSNDNAVRACGPNGYWHHGRRQRARPRALHPHRWIPYMMVRVRRHAPV